MRLKMTQATFFLVLVGALLSACHNGSQNDTTQTPAPLAVATFVPTAKTIKSPQAIIPLPSPTEIQHPITPYPTMLLPTYTGDTAPPFAEFNRIISTIVASSWGDDALNGNIGLYNKQLAGKKVSNWSGWVITSGKQYQKDTYYVKISGDDPYIPAQLLTPTPTPDIHSRPFTPVLTVELTGLSSKMADAIYPGEKVTFNGTIINLEFDSFSGNYIHIENVSTITPLIDDRPLPALPADISDVVMTFERTLCFGSCPAYKVTVYGDGKVVWEGTNYVKVKGTVNSRISLNQVQQLLVEYLKVDFFAIPDHDAYYETDTPSYKLSLVMGGKTHQVDHSAGDPNAAVKLQILENKIDQILNTKQWIGDQG